MRKRLNHEPPPFYYSDAPTFFITICAQDRGKNTFCHPDPGQAVLDSIRFRNERKIWHCALAVLMPDHVHLILHFPDGASMSQAVGDWKRYLTQNQGIAWQRNFFDHRVRPGENFGQKTEYVLLNPERAGLIQKAEDWPYTWIAEG
jgi:REP element-mobilizing transposase RayT